MKVSRLVGADDVVSEGGLVFSAVRCGIQQGFREKM